MSEFGYFSMKSLVQSLRDLRRMNWLMNVAVAVLLGIGVAFVYSASYASEVPGGIGKHIRQLVWIGLGLISYVAFSALNYRWLAKWAPGVYIGTLVLLVYVLVGGVTIYGARRWISLGGGALLQPSEFAKIACLFAVAKWLSRPGVTGANWRYIGGVGILTMIPFVLVLREPDLGTALIFLPVSMALLFVAGFPWRVLALIGLVGALAFGTLAATLLAPEKLGMGEADVDRALTRMGLHEHQKARLKGFFRPDWDPQGAGWNKKQSEIAIGSGGATGTGFLQGKQNLLRFLPKSVAPTDFIFAVIAEEAGFLGSVCVLFFFGVVLVCGMHASLLAPDKLGHLLCTGVMTLLFCHVFINMAMTVGLLPIVGVPLPLLSYGGSFMIVTMSSLGIVQSVYIRSRRAGFFEVV